MIDAARLLAAGDPRVLTVKPPWSWAIAWGGKTVENRTALWAWRGLVLIHAGAGWSTRGATDPRVCSAYALAGDPDENHAAWVDAVGGPSIAPPERHGSILVHPSGLERWRPPAQHIWHSAIVAVAELADVHPDAECCRPWGESSYTEASGRHRGDVAHLVLEDVTPLVRPVPYAHGGLGLRRPHPDLIGEVADALEAAA